MTHLLVDSDVLIEVLRGRDKAILAKWADIAEEGPALLYSPITVAELWHGLRNGEVEDVTELLQRMICVPIDAETGRLAGRFLGRYHSSHGVQIGDALIAASTAVNQAKLWTRNRKHYPMPELSFG